MPDVLRKDSLAHIAGVEGRLRRVQAFHTMGSESAETRRGDRCYPFLRCNPPSLVHGAGSARHGSDVRCSRRVQVPVFGIGGPAQSSSTHYHRIALRRSRRYRPTTPVPLVSETISTDKGTSSYGNSKLRRLASQDDDVSDPLGADLHGREEKATDVLLHGRRRIGGAGAEGFCWSGAARFEFGKKKRVDAVKHQAEVEDCRLRHNDGGENGRVKSPPKNAPSAGWKDPSLSKAREADREAGSSTTVSVMPPVRPSAEVPCNKPAAYESPPGASQHSRLPPPASRYSAYNPIDCNLTGAGPLCGGRTNEAPFSAPYGFQSFESLHIGDGSGRVGIGKAAISTDVRHLRGHDGDVGRGSPRKSIPRFGNRAVNTAPLFSDWKLCVILNSVSGPTVTTLITSHAHDHSAIPTLSGKLSSFPTMILSTTPTISSTLSSTTAYPLFLPTHTHRAVIEEVAASGGNLLWRPQAPLGDHKASLRYNWDIHANPVTAYVLDSESTLVVCDEGVYQIDSTGDYCRWRGTQDRIELGPWVYCSFFWENESDSDDSGCAFHS
ncbi:hypothetical protein BJ508DRAFT_378016 [Ascobolus immersus RN42]|uniref:Uncharacterized protein n=1 Tax=Ascobolus immersus RN42 TaxID=1160509 RepID=A0A3N4HYH8_ASCIM|nr:hypothetical protein BJ508DRAFT_378016 [Ascobolus immersus RN42]